MMNISEKNLNCKACFTAFLMIIIFLISSINVIAMVQIRENVERTPSNSSPISNSITCDLKVKSKSNEWQDKSISVNVGDVVEFKGSVQAGKKYKEVYVCFLLSDTEKSIFEYVQASAYPLPSLNEGIFFPTNNAVIWIWLNVNGDWQKEMIFKCKLKEKGSANVVLKVFGIIDGENYEKCEDSIIVESTKARYIWNFKLLKTILDIPRNLLLKF